MDYSAHESNRKYYSGIPGTKIDIPRGADLSNACGLAQTQKESPVGEAIGMIDGEITQLEHKVERLTIRLQPVLRPVPPDSGSPSLFPDGVAELPTRLIYQAARLNTVSIALETLLDRLVL